MGRNLARAIADIGDDVTKYGAGLRQSEQHAATLSVQERIAKMRDDTANAIAEVKAANAALIAEMRGGRRSGSRGGGAGDDDLTPAEREQLAAARSEGGGMPVPDYRIGRKVDVTGEFPKRPAFDMDDEGRPLEGPQTQDFENRKKYEELAKRSRPGFVESMIAPKDWKGGEEALTERAQREDVYRAGADVSAAGRRSAALKGTLPAAEAMAAKAGKEAGEADRKERAALEGQLTDVARIIKDYERDIVFMAKAKEKGSEEAERLADLQQRATRLKAQLGLITPDRMKEPKVPPAPAPEPRPIPKLPAGAVQIGTSGGKPVYQTPDGQRFRGQ